MPTSLSTFVLNKDRVRTQHRIQRASPKLPRLQSPKLGGQTEHSGWEVGRSMWTWQVPSVWAYKRGAFLRVIMTAAVVY